MSVVQVSVEGLGENRSFHSIWIEKLRKLVALVTQAIFQCFKNLISLFSKKQPVIERENPLSVSLRNHLDVPEGDPDLTGTPIMGLQRNILRIAEDPTQGGALGIG